MVTAIQSRPPISIGAVTNTMEGFGLIIGICYRNCVFLNFELHFTCHESTRPLLTDLPVN